MLNKLHEYSNNLIILNTANFTQNKNATEILCLCLCVTDVKTFERRQMTLTFVSDAIQQI